MGAEWSSLSNDLIRAPDGCRRRGPLPFLPMVSSPERSFDAPSIPGQYQCVVGAPVDRWGDGWYTGLAVVALGSRAEGACGGGDRNRVSTYGAARQQCSVNGRPPGPVTTLDRIERIQNNGERLGRSIRSIESVDESNGAGILLCWGLAVMQQMGPNMSQPTRLAANPP
jgi:hypothetical protein